jgi:hypothetical protein
MTISVRPELIPVLSKYGTSVSDVLSTPEDVQKIAAAWIERFSTKLASGSVDDIMSLLISDQPIWRDFLVLSWTFTTQTGVEGVRGFLKENITKDYFVKFEPSDMAAKVMQVNDEVAWINAFASFETSKGRGTAVAHLVPVREHGENELCWKAQGILTDLDELKGHEPLLGPRRKQEPTLGGWEDSLEQAQQFKDDDPTVVIIGGSQNGLSVAARLKMLGISAIVLERNSRLGDSWRGRYGTKHCRYRFHLLIYAGQMHSVSMIRFGMITLRICPFRPRGPSTRLLGNSRIGSSRTRPYWSFLSGSPQTPPRCTVTARTTDGMSTWMFKERRKR